MIVASIRSALRDPLYVHECRQARLRRGGASGLWPLLAALPVACCCLGGGAIYAMAGLWTAESVLGELDRGTLEGLLLTPLDRKRILWAKLLARLRPFVWVGCLLPAVLLPAGLVVGALIPQHDLAVLWGGLIGLGAGALLGAMIIGQSLTCSALGLLAAAHGRARFQSYLLALAMTYGLGMIDSVLATALYIPAFVAGPWFGKLGGPLLAVVIAVGALLFLAAVAGRIFLVNFYIPARIVSHTAARFDEMLLKDS